MQSIATVKKSSWVSLLNRNAVKFNCFFFEKLYTNKMDFHTNLIINVIKSVPSSQISTKMFQEISLPIWGKITDWWSQLFYTLKTNLFVPPNQICVALRYRLTGADYSFTFLHPHPLAVMVRDLMAGQIVPPGTFNRLAVCRGMSGYRLLFSSYLNFPFACPRQLLATLLLVGGGHGKRRKCLRLN